MPMTAPVKYLKEAAQGSLGSSSPVFELVSVCIHQCFVSLQGPNRLRLFLAYAEIMVSFHPFSACASPVVSFPLRVLSLTSTGTLVSSSVDLGNFLRFLMMMD